MLRAYAPGRINLIGEHTDYTGGLVLPMAIDLGTTVLGERIDGAIRLRSRDVPGSVEVPVPVAAQPPAGLPEWGRYVHAVAVEVGDPRGVDGEVSTTLPVGAGLSSSASLEVAVALAIGADPEPRQLAGLCQRAEHRARGVPCGIMDQLAATMGRAGHALLVDCSTLAVRPIPVPETARFVVVHSGEQRELAGSAYAERTRECAAAEAVIGPLARAAPGDESAIDDPVVRRRARHVIGENRRVSDFVAAFEAGDLAGAGELMGATHRSLRDDFEVSTPRIDALVGHLAAIDGVLGVRLVGAGFGGCVLALCEPGAQVDGWWVRASDGAAIS